MENQNITSSGRLLSKSPAWERSQRQKTLQAAGIYPKLPDGTLVPEITQLSDGKFFLSGGVGKINTYSKNTWIYDVKTKRLVPGPKLIRESIKHATLLLNDGRVLITGGSTARPIEIDDVLIFDPAKNTIKKIGLLAFARYEHAMTEISPGKIVITGGVTRNGDGDEIEIFDLSSGASRMVSRLAKPRKQHDSLKIGPDKLVVLGGRGYEHTRAELPAEIVTIRENR